jgi:hypothetical protein
MTLTRDPSYKTDGEVASHRDRERNDDPADLH